MGTRVPIWCMMWGMSKRRKKQQQSNQATGAKTSEPKKQEGCIVCGESPVFPDTDMCGPCTFGEAATAGGNW